MKLLYLENNKKATEQKKNTFPNCVRTAFTIQ